MIEPQKPIKLEDHKIHFTEAGSVVIATNKAGDQIGAIPTDPQMLQGYIMAINQMLLYMPSVPELVQFRHEAGRLFERGGK